MPQYGMLSTRKTPQETRRDIDDTFEKWGIDDWRVPRQNGRSSYGPAMVIFYVNDQKQDLTCSRFDRYQDNLRAVYLILEALRLAQERGILKELARAAVALLPPGNGACSAYAVLDIAEGASLEVAEAAYKALAKKHHPDKGGSDKVMRELNRAIEELRAKPQARPA